MTRPERFDSSPVHMNLRSTILLTGALLIASGASALTASAHTYGDVYSVVVGANPITADSWYLGPGDTTYSPDKAFDQNDATYWESSNSAFPHTLTIQFTTTTHSLGQVMIHDPSDYAGLGDFKMFGSNDGSSWTQIGTGTSTPAFSGSAHYFNFDDTAQYSYIRYEQYNNFQADNYAVIHSIEYRECTDCGGPTFSTVVSMVYPTSTVPEFSNWAVNVSNLYTTTTSFSDGVTVEYSFATTSQSSLDRGLDPFTNNTLFRSNDFQVPRGSAFKFQGLYYVRPAYFVTTYGANATTTWYYGSWSTFTFDVNAPVPVGTVTWNGVSGTNLSDISGPFGNHARNLLGEPGVSAYASSSELCTASSTSFSFLDPFGSSSLSAIGCTAQGVGKWLVGLIILPHDYSLGLFQGTFSSFKTTFPFVVFFQYTDALRSAAGLAPVDETLAMTIPPFGTIQLLSSSTLDQAFGASTTDILVPHSTMKEKIFAVQKAVMVIGTIMSAVGILWI